MCVMHDGTRTGRNKIHDLDPCLPKRHPSSAASIRTGVGETKRVPSSGLPAALKAELRLAGRRRISTTSKTGVELRASDANCIIDSRGGVAGSIERRTHLELRLSSAGADLADLVVAIGIALEVVTLHGDAICIGDSTYYTIKVLGQRAPPLRITLPSSLPSTPEVSGTVVPTAADGHNLQVHEHDLVIHVG